MVINSEAEYHEVTERLARQLLSELTPEHIAVIAAQHLIYVDTLEQAKAERPGRGFMPAKSKYIRMSVDEFRQALKSVAKPDVNGTVEIVKFTLDAYRKHVWGKGGKARHAGTASLKAKLLAEWDDTHDHYKGQADFARIVSKREGMKERTLYEWISKHRKKPG